jgi:hypothetical protein
MGSEDMKATNVYCQRVLRRAKTLLNSPDNWLKEEFAVAADNSRVFPFSSNACRFCLIGALNRAEFELYERADQLYGTECLQRIAGRSIRIFGVMPVAFNDNPATTHGDIIRYLDALIDSFDPWYTKIIRAIKKRI